MIGAPGGEQLLRAAGRASVRRTLDEPTAHASTAAATAQNPAAPGVSAHFVNNVLAAAASYIEEDPDLARDVLAELGQFLAYGLRPSPIAVPLAQELEHTATYLRLQQARFPGRIELRLEAAEDRTGTTTAGSVRASVERALDARLRTVSGPCLVDLHAAEAGLELVVRGPDDLVGDAIPIPLSPTQEVRP